jgi:hypothetical protein
MDNKAEALGKKFWRELSDDEVEYITTMDGAEYGDYKRMRMSTSGIGAMLEKFEKVAEKSK